MVESSESLRKLPELSFLGLTPALLNQSLWFEPGNLLYKLPKWFLMCSQVWQPTALNPHLRFFLGAFPSDSISRGLQLMSVIKIDHFEIPLEISHVPVSQQPWVTQERGRTTGEKDQRHLLWLPAAVCSQQKILKPIPSC